MTINNNLVRYNAELLFNSPKETNFDVNHKGKLEVISKWNLLGRFIKWIMNRDGAITEKVNQTVTATLKSIAETLQSFNNNPNENLVYVHKLSHFLGIFFASSSSQYPAYILANKVQNSSQFSNVETIKNYCNQILQQKEKYPNSPAPAYDDPKILLVDERPNDFKGQAAALKKRNDRMQMINRINAHEEKFHNTEE